MKAKKCGVSKSALYSERKIQSQGRQKKEPNQDTQGKKPGKKRPRVTRDGAAGPKRVKSMH